ncbi:protein MIS12 homolog isoform X1 [Olea europaea var. sylvestris]|uniref:protein MIS12 homolog isoform X1 n=1 Tax=Olea europaea var. sylvestris TaxID=158386 RepID=UPI000C1D2B44|nr:protein MIS12 homolog isoform X1 [Olea europaea var. sylvestris]XP_022854222.1 protein MIS12 homolog isoform X1 [Olea europaea var. sylvestris]
MEVSESNAIFESLNLNPQLFINEVLNFVDDLTDEAFNYFLEEASAQMKTEGTDRSADLSRGVAYIRNLVQLTLDNRLKKWEEYSLRFCFHVPEGFSLTKANPSSADDLSDLDTLADTELDAQLNSLRDKLTLVGKESNDLRKELLALEKQSLSSNQCAGSVKEALQLYEKQATTKTLQELATTALEFRSKLEKLNRRSMDEIQSIRAKRLRIPQEDMFQMNLGKGLFNGKLDDLQQFLDEI